MTSSIDTLERELVHDLASLGDQIADDRHSEALYRALTNTTWRKAGGPEGHLSLSWSRAEELVNELRARHDHEPLTLAQTGGEGEVSERVRELLEPLGWRPGALDTSRHDPQHDESATQPPPGDQGERDAPVDDPHAWRREGDAEADAEQLRRREGR
jgi:hypothetical protein